MSLALHKLSAFPPGADRATNLETWRIQLEDLRKDGTIELPKAGIGKLKLSGFRHGGWSAKDILGPLFSYFPEPIQEELMGERVNNSVKYSDLVRTLCNHGATTRCSQEEAMVALDGGMCPECGLELVRFVHKMDGMEALVYFRVRG